jgi:hypothetical protein
LSQDLSTTVKVTFGSMEDKAKLIKEGFKVYFQSHRVVSFEEDPDVLQGFRCQAIGHMHGECKAERQRCLCCGGDHWVGTCSVAR